MTVDWWQNNRFSVTRTGEMLVNIGSVACLWYTAGVAIVLKENVLINNGIRRSRRCKPWNEISCGVYNLCKISTSAILSDREWQDSDQHRAP
jgi:hypothetical protein